MERIFLGKTCTDIVSQGSHNRAKYRKALEDRIEKVYNYHCKIYLLIPCAFLSLFSVFCKINYLQCNQDDLTHLSVNAHDRVTEI